MAPWSHHLLMVAVSLVAIAAEFGNNLAHFLDAIASGDQQGVLGIDNDQVVRADHTHKPLAAYIAAPSPVHDGIADDAVIVIVRGQHQFADAGPRPHIAPYHGVHHSDDPFRFFHHRLV